MTEQRNRPTVFALWLIVAGIIGWWAAFQLTLERFHLLQNPDAILNCDISPLVQCKANLESAQGSVFGFANPLLGLTMWFAPIVVGVAILAGARFAKWFWFLFWTGFVFAQGFVIWLMTQSIFELGTLCPWCMVTWAVVIPSFWAVTFHVMRIGVFGDGLKDLGDKLMSWTPLFTVVSYVAVAVMAQVRLDLLNVLFV
ncbi:vitamin K epoxide reductase family protein [Microbacterium sp. NC79]|uniref:vitamin K epoxide reductase family protein n=1 Tax=Microbacterium sp. NC79 TaxID=2851009 RepID=UPI001C2C7BFD|nr:vitamin K epoxide reductase family protein [Microbacterium sp. NC79]MBV0894775.1 vitamin K epoxide reductase family protein [Microbacterium sp. NC79]